MTIIIKDVPGLTTREVLQALADITDPNDPPIATGHGGLVVDEDVAERFLSAYLIVAGKRPVPTRTPVVVESTNGPTRAVEPTGSTPVVVESANGPARAVEPTGPTPAVEPTGPTPARPTTRRAGKRKEA